MPSSAKKETFFARIFDMTMHTIISGDTNDHRGMRVEEEREEGGGGEEESLGHAPYLTQLPYLRKVGK